MNDLTLYNITNGFVHLMQNDEIADDDKAKIEEELNVMLQQKSGSIIGYTRNLELTIEAMKNEEKRIADNRKTMENKLARFKEYVKDCMEKSGILKVETSLGNLSIAKNPISVEVVNADLIPDTYKKKEITIKIDKKAIADNFKTTGELIDGVNVITDKTSLRIK